MIKLLLSAALATCLSLSAIAPAAAVELYGGDPIGASPYSQCMAMRPSDKSLCDKLQPSQAAFDLKLLSLPTPLSDEERRHKEMMNGLRAIESALRNGR